MKKFVTLSLIFGAMNFAIANDRLIDLSKLSVNDLIAPTEEQKQCNKTHSQNNSEEKSFCSIDWFKDNEHSFSRGFEPRSNRSRFN